MYTCSKLAAVVLLSLNFGGEIIRYLTMVHRSILVDDVHALLERYEFVLRTYPMATHRGQRRQVQKANIFLSTRYSSDAKQLASIRHQDDDRLLLQPNAEDDSDADIFHMAQMDDELDVTTDCDQRELERTRSAIEWDYRQTEKRTKGERKTQTKGRDRIGAHVVRSE